MKNKVITGIDYGYDIPPYLRRQRPKTARYGLPIAIVGFTLMAAAFFVVLMAWGASHAHAQGVAGVIENGRLYTPSQFCDTL